MDNIKEITMDDLTMESFWDDLSWDRYFTVGIGQGFLVDVKFPGYNDPTNEKEYQFAFSYIMDNTDTKSEIYHPDYEGITCRPLTENEAQIIRNFVDYNAEAYVEEQLKKAADLRKNPYEEKNFKIQPIKDVTDIISGYLVRSDSKRFGQNQIVFQGSTFDECLKYISDKEEPKNPSYYVIKDLASWSSFMEYPNGFPEKSPIERFDSVDDAIAKFNEYKGMDYLKEEVMNPQTGEPARRLTLGVSLGGGELDLLHTENDKTLILSDILGERENGYEGFLTNNKFVGELNKITQNIQIDEYSCYRDMHQIELFEEVRRKLFTPVIGSENKDGIAYDVWVSGELAKSFGSKEDREKWLDDFCEKYEQDGYTQYIYGSAVAELSERIVPYKEQQKEAVYEANRILKKDPDYLKKHKINERIQFEDFAEEAPFLKEDPFKDLWKVYRRDKEGQPKEWITELPDGNPAWIIPENDLYSVYLGEYPYATLGSIMGDPAFKLEPDNVFNTFKEAKNHVDRFERCVTELDSGKKTNVITGEVIRESWERPKTDKINIKDMIKKNSEVSKEQLKAPAQTAEKKKSEVSL